ncbi:hypothetical protein MP213Fo_11790 [Pseudochrobactrum sp. MP213Fo]
MQKAGANTGLLFILEHFTIKLNQLDRYDNANTLKSRALRSPMASLDGHDNA